MDNFNDKLKQFLHDPIDKCFEIQSHLKRAKDYAKIVGVSGIFDVKEPDFIASCMERSFLPSPLKYGFSEDELYQKFNEIRHPFSDGKIEVPDIDKNKVFERTKKVFENLKLPLDDQLKFFYLWRNLPEETLAAFEGDSVYKYIPILPADTRIPDHSIWEHLKVSAAINAFENIQNNSLFLFSIGPVQSFITQSRKTQDMFMGSFILSYLTFTAIQAVVEEYGPTNVIYPDLQGQPLMDWFLKTKGIDVKNSFEKYLNQPTIPNRFVAILPMTNEVDIEKFANLLEGVVKDEWNRMADYVLDSFKLDEALKDRGRNVNMLKENQTLDFPQIFWTAIPLRKGDRDINLSDLSSFFEKEDIVKWDELKDFIEEKSEYPPNVGFLYGLAYLALEKSLGASKNLRMFKQTEEYGKKCNLCGEREAVIKSGLGNLRTGKYVSSTEGLCIQCFTKRALDRYLEEKFDFSDFYFPSTAEIASSDFKEELLVESKEAFCSYVDSFKSVTGGKFPLVRVPFLKKIAEENPDVINFDGEWFFEENLTKKEFKDEFDMDISDSELDELKNKLKILTKDNKPNSYYAIIMLDGDSMGKWLSGEKLPPIENAYNSAIWNKLPEEFKSILKEKSPNKILTPAIHEAVSVALKNYSLEIVRYVVEEEYLGKIVYSGGDDVVALVNLRDLLEVLRKLRAGFSGQLKFLDGHTEVVWENRSGFIEKDGKYFLTMGPNASLSAGVLISHYKSPLKVVLDRVRMLEKDAKKNKDKDSFSIGLMKRSGGLREIVCNFKIESEGKWVDTLHEIEAIGKYFEESSKVKISRTFPIKLYENLENLTDENGNFLGSSDIFNVELKRLLGRSVDGPKEEKYEAVEELSKSFKALFFNSGIGGNLNNFVNLLEITSFLFGKGD